MKNLYAVHDRKALSYGTLMCIPNDVVAIREFGAAIEYKDSVIAKYAEDFELVCLGSFDDSSGVTGAVPVVGDEPRVVITAEAWLSSRPQQPRQLELMQEEAR